MKCIFRIGSCLDACEPVSYKLGVMIETTKLYTRMYSLNDMSLNHLDFHLKSESHKTGGTCAVIVV